MVDWENSKMIIRVNLVTKQGNQRWEYIGKPSQAHKNDEDTDKEYREFEVVARSLGGPISFENLISCNFKCYKGFNEAYKMSQYIQKLYCDKLGKLFRSISVDVLNLEIIENDINNFEFHDMLIKEKF